MRSTQPRPSQDLTINIMWYPKNSQLYKLIIITTNTLFSNSFVRDSNKTLFFAPPPQTNNSYILKGFKDEAIQNTVNFKSVAMTSKSLIVS